MYLIQILKTVKYTRERNSHWPTATTSWLRSSVLDLGALHPDCWVLCSMARKSSLRCFDGGRNATRTAKNPCLKAYFSTPNPCKGRTKKKSLTGSFFYLGFILLTKLGFGGSNSGFLGFCGCKLRSSPLTTSET